MPLPDFVTELDSNQHRIAARSEYRLNRRFYEKRPDCPAAGGAERRGSGRPKCL